MIQAACCRVGPLAHLLRNRFYIGEIVYRGEVHVGTHEPILDRDLFEAVQARLDAQAAQRRTLRSRTPAPLAGLLFDAAGHAMSPSHASKAGVRYRYHVSQALLRGRREDAGAVARVSAPEIEAAVLAAMRARPGTGADADPAAPSKPCPHDAAGASTDTDDIRHRLALVDSVTLHGDRVVITWRPGEAGAASPAPLTVPFRKAFSPRKDVAHEPVAHAADPRRREVLLAAIVRARRWIDDLVEGRADSFEEIAARGDKTVRHVRRLSVLAYLSPKLTAAIVCGATGPEVTIASLTSGLPMAWADQDRAFLASR